MKLSPRYQRTLSQFLKDTSIPGLSHAARARSWIRYVVKDILHPQILAPTHFLWFLLRALYWLAILVAGTVFTVRGLVIIINDFLTYPSVTTNTFNTPPSVPFPAVTVCNLNRIHCLNLVEIRMSYSTDGKSDVYNISYAELDNLIFNETKCDEQVTSD